jgi:hypothetical protein
VCVKVEEDCDATEVEKMAMFYEFGCTDGTVVLLNADHISSVEKHGERNCRVRMALGEMLWILAHPFDEVVAKLTATPQTPTKDDAVGGVGPPRHSLLVEMVLTKCDGRAIGPGWRA